MKLTIAEFLLMTGFVGTALLAIGFIIGEIAAKIHHDHHHRKGHQ